jgi:hypothetical protein
VVEWQTQQTQNLPTFTRREGSSPSSPTIIEFDERKKAGSVALARFLRQERLPEKAASKHRTVGMGEAKAVMAEWEAAASWDGELPTPQSEPEPTSEKVRTTIADAA